MNIIDVFKDIFVSPIDFIYEIIISLTRQSRLFLMGLLVLGVIIFGLLVVCVLKKQFPVFTKTWFKDHMLFVLTNCVLAILMGVVIPVIVVSSSPIEFYEGGIAPLLLVVHNFLLYFGLFLIYLLGVYAIVPSWLKRIMEGVGIFFVGISLSSFIGYGWNLGIMGVMFTYDKGVEYSTTAKIVSIMIMLIMVVLPVILFKIKKSESIFKAIIGMLLVVGLWMGVSNIFIMQNKLSRIYVDRQSTEDNHVLELSKNGKNVVFIMLDRAIGRYIPFITNEHPELLEEYDGFVYYPNAVSLAKSTNLSTPSLFGGYEYSPKNINKRKEEKLVDKHNEALKVMPKLFRDNDFAVTVCDAPCANYQWSYDMSIYDDIEGVRAFNIIGKHMEENEPFRLANEKKQRHNLAGYSLMRSLPAKFQKLIYDSGNYLSTAKPITVSDVFMQSYTGLTALPSLTEISDNSENTFLMMQNGTTHEPSLLQRPEYEPSVDEPTDVYEDMERFELNGVRINMEDNLAQMQHYHINNAAILRLADWFEYLKEKGVYDNTRIIIASDHAFELNQFNDMSLENGLDVEGLNCLLMIKDFDAHGVLLTDETLMSTADVPTIAVSGVIEKPVNPYTGNNINSEEKKNGITITTSGNWVFEGNNDNVWDLSDGEFWTVHGDVLSTSSWRKTE